MTNESQGGRVPGMREQFEQMMEARLDDVAARREGKWPVLSVGGLPEPARHTRSCPNVGTVNDHADISLNHAHSHRS